MIVYRDGCYLPRTVHDHEPSPCSATTAGLGTRCTSWLLVFLHS